MRGKSVRRLTALCLVPLVALALLAAAHLAINSQRDGVTVTETALTGDPAAAAGVTVTDRWSWNGDLFWETRYGPGRETETDFAFRPGGSASVRPLEFQLASASFNGGMSGSDLLAEETKIWDDWAMDSFSFYLERLARKAADTAGPGETVTKTVRLAEEFSLLPLSVDLQVWDDDGERVLVRSWGQEGGTELITGFFSIPMPEDAAVEVSVTKDLEGKVVEINSSDLTSIPWVGGTGMVFPGEKGAEGYVLFTLNTGSEAPADLSHVKEGQGLYLLRYGACPAGEGNSASGGTAFTELHTVYPFQEGETFQCMNRSPSGDQVLLATRVGEELVLTVLSPDGSQVLQRLSLGVSPEAGVSQLYPYEDWLGAYLSDGTFLVLGRGEAGYTRELAVNLLELAKFPTFSPWNLTLDYDGQRLAAAVLTEEYPESEAGVWVRPETLAGLQVFDREGTLLYAARYENLSPIRYCEALYTNWGDGVGEAVLPSPLSVKLEE